jgi:hypothetical protein
MSITQPSCSRSCLAAPGIGNLDLFIWTTLTYLSRLPACTVMILLAFLDDLYLHYLDDPDLLSSDDLERKGRVISLKSAWVYWIYIGRGCLLRGRSKAS